MFVDLRSLWEAGQVNLYDWPNPRATPANVALLTWTVAAFPPISPATAQYDWPNPGVPQRSSELRTWIQDPQPAPNPIPIAQFDWPNPLPKPPNLELRFWYSAFAGEELGPIAPAQLDWPNPLPKPPNLDLRGWIQAPIPAPNPIPPRQTEWPNPLLAKRSIDALSWSWSFPPAPAPSAPFGPYDWPNPVLARANLELRGWIQDPVPTPNAIPNAQRDWQNPQPLRRSGDSLTWIASIQAVPPTPPPVNQFDWPNPKLRQVPTVDVYTWTQFTPPLPATGIPMPNVVGLNYYMAIETLQNAGIYLPLVTYAFEPSSITVQWKKTNLPGGIVTAQSIAASLRVPPGAPVTLTVSEFPFGGIIDSPPDWKQRH